MASQQKKTFGTFILKSVYVLSLKETLDELC